ncbi:MAG TPA: restriction endonuclease, partial [Bacilli bacterium]|nr:restriction endonuclease [Bacilli bacterium]
MGNYFWHDQPNSRQDDYIEMLKIIGSLSKLFSDSSDPYLYYRAHENLFCQVFNAKNLARGDVSFDAIADKIGIGLKTFLHGNGRTFQKVAEFNSDSDLIRALQPRLEDVVYKVAELRNRRIRLTEDITNINQNIYHVVTREKGKMNITETAMDYIDISSIQLDKKQSKNTIKFKDKYNEYSFSLSKNTLLKRFDTTKSEIITQFEVEILDDPFNFLKSHHVLSQTAIQSNLEDDDFIILPLYSPSTKNVEQKSGLNQWNAGGRARNINEVYIPIP